MKINIITLQFLVGVILVVSGSSAFAHTDVTAQQARELIDSTDDLTVIDVREPYEYNSAGGHIPGALNYPWYAGVLQAQYEELPMDTPLLVVCGSGSRSNRAADFLDSMDFSMVYDMLGGMAAWKWETVTGNEPYSKYGGGAGEPNEPYLIYTAEQLNAVGAEPNDWDKNFKLMADIDLSGYSYDRAVIAPDINDVNSGFQGIPFTGVFDGNSCKISYLSCMSKGKSYVALFGYVSGYSAEIKHLGLIDPNVSAEQNALSTGSLTGELLYGTITNCYVEGCNISGENFVGGLVGGNNHGTIRNCYAIGTVSGFEHLGGLAGGNSGWIMNSYTDVSVTGNNTIGGLVGYNAGGRESVGTIQQCYSVGILMGDSEVGGLVGGQPGIVIDSFWDIETSGQIESASGEGKITVEMQMAGMFIEAGWDFVGETDNGTEDIWSICEGTNYPLLVWQIPMGDFVCPDGIDRDDFFFLLEFWLNDNCDSSNDFCQGTDLDQSGTVDGDDLEIFFESWLAEK
jgi:rhodanese-related sulfurtransferase